MIGRTAMTDVAVENARQQWEEGHRRLPTGRSTGTSTCLLDEVGLVLDELSRRVGQTFTLAELAQAYPRPTGGARRPRLALRRRHHLALVGDAAFHVYARGAVDYSP